MSTWPQRIGILCGMAFEGVFHRCFGVCRRCRRPSSAPVSMKTLLPAPQCTMLKRHAARLRKLPKHVAMCWARRSSPLLAALAQRHLSRQSPTAPPQEWASVALGCVWLAVLGVREITLYDPDGLLAANVDGLMHHLRAVLAAMESGGVLRASDVVRGSLFHTPVARDKRRRGKPSKNERKARETSTPPGATCLCRAAYELCTGEYRYAAELRCLGAQRDSVKSQTKSKVYMQSNDDKSSAAQTRTTPHNSKPSPINAGKEVPPDDADMNDETPAAISTVQASGATENCDDKSATSSTKRSSTETNSSLDSGQPSAQKSTSGAPSQTLQCPLWELDWMLPLPLVYIHTQQRSDTDPRRTLIRCISRVHGAVSTAKVISNLSQLASRFSGDARSGHAPSSLHPVQITDSIVKALANNTSTAKTHRHKDTGKDTHEGDRNVGVDKTSASVAGAGEERKGPVNASDTLKSRQHPGTNDASTGKGSQQLDRYGTAFALLMRRVMLCAEEPDCLLMVSASPDGGSSLSGFPYFLMRAAEIQRVPIDGTDLAPETSPKEQKEEVDMCGNTDVPNSSTLPQSCTKPALQYSAGGLGDPRRVCAVLTEFAGRVQRLGK